MKAHGEGKGKKKSHREKIERVNLSPPPDRRRKIYRRASDQSHFAVTVTAVTIILLNKTRTETVRYQRKER